MQKILDGSENDELTVSSVYISQITYGETAGQYTGKITFKNKTGDEFTFKLDDTETRKMMNFIGKRVKETANSFTEKLKRLFFID
jgi:hypothetical protein